ncbi:hypothetical protein STEG23_027597, partial [Scotinomys teguina]
YGNQNLVVRTTQSTLSGNAQEAKQSPKFTWASERRLTPTGNVSKKPTKIKSGRSVKAEMCFKPDHLIPCPGTFSHSDNNFFASMTSQLSCADQGPSPESPLDSVPPHQELDPGIRT